MILKQRPHTLQATLLVALSGILYGLLGYTGIQIINEGFSLYQMLFWRFLIASIWTLIVIGYKQKKVVGLATFKLATFQAFFLGAICYTGTSLLYFMASQRIGTGLAMVIFFLYPILIVAINAFFYKERLTKPIVCSLILILFGLLWLNHDQGIPLERWGFVWAVASAACYAAYIVLSKLIVVKLDVSLLTLWVCVGCTLLFFILGSAEPFNYPHTVVSWCYILVLGSICTALPIQLLAEGIKVIGTAKAAILSVLEPITTVLVGALLLNETISSMQWLGIVTILVAALVVQLTTKN